MAPPVRRTASSAYGPSAGLPIASERAIVDGFTGLTVSQPFSYAVAIGEQPVAWAPYTFHGEPSTSPSLVSSPKALSTLVSSEPDAIGMTTCSGSRQPSCSATSYPRVLLPSA